MLTAEKKKKYTVEDYLLLEEGAPFQLINYDLVMSPSPIPLHQLISVKFAQALLNFLDSKNDDGFVVSAPMDVKFDEGNILQPDVLYIAEERITEIVKQRVEGAPDLVVEILSPSSAYYDLRQKKDIYEKCAVKEHIIIDPIQESAEVYSLKDGVYIMNQKVQKTESITSVLLPGFSFPLTKVFR